jgi:hypothetical protein
MTVENNFDRHRAVAGLCASCKNSRRIESQRGSEFWLCQLSATDPRFAKYPRLPVLSCPGYAQNEWNDANTSPESI